MSSNLTASANGPPLVPVRALRPQIAVVCKHGRSASSPIFWACSSVGKQRSAHNRLVAGSSPARPTNIGRENIPPPVLNQATARTNGSRLMSSRKVRW